MDKKVKGILFVDYVRMIRSRKDIDWSKHLPPEDMHFLKQRIIDSEWYPLDTFERMGVAILKAIANGDVNAVRLWGLQSIDNLLNMYSELVCDGDPRESMMRFQVLRSSFFNFTAIDLQVIFNNYAKLEITYGMGKVAEEAASYQAAGFFERLLKESGAKNIRYTFKSKSWEGDSTTILEMEWE